MNELVMDLIHTYAGEDIDMCYWLWQIIKEDKEPEKCLYTFFDNIRKVKSINTTVLKKVISIDDLHKMDDLYSKYINEVILTLVRTAHINNWDESIFYTKLWNILWSDVILNDDILKAFAVFKMAQNPIMPYFMLGTPLHMENDEFVEIANQKQDSLARVRHILESNYQQKTEVASLLLNEIQNENDFKCQSVILAVALDIFSQTKVNNMIQIMGNGGVKIESAK